MNSCWKWLTVFPFAMACSVPSRAMACPMCKFALESDDPLPRAYMYSILFMLAVIGGIFLVLAVLVHWLVKNEQAALDAAGYQHLFENGVSESRNLGN